MSCIGRGLCDGLITRPEESYRVSNVSVITETPKGALCSRWEPKGNESYMCINIHFYMSSHVLFCSIFYCNNVCWKENCLSAEL
jgi:hypothetical protein